MRLRGKDNAASAGFTVAAFLGAGSVIVAGAVLAGFEVAVIKFGIVAYLFMAGPLFVASRLGGGWRPKHKSFRATPPPCMKGKRVKRRLRLVAVANALLFLATLTLTYFGQYWALSQVARDLDPSGVVVVVFMVGPLAAAYLASAAFWSLAVKGGWLTPEEAQSRRDHFKGRWPESWLEPADNKDGK